LLRGCHVGDFCVGREFRGLCEIGCGQVSTFEKRLENSAFIEQARGLRKVFDAEIHDFYAQRIVLVIHAGVGDKDVEFFVAGAEGGGLLEGCKRLLGLRITNVCLGEEIVNGGGGMSGAAERCEDGDRFIELIGCGVTEREVEVRGEFIGDAALGCEEMRNGFAEVALAREVGSGLELLLGAGGCAGIAACLVWFGLWLTNVRRRRLGGRESMRELSHVQRCAGCGGRLQIDYGY
jgi:hypothetical protein